MRRKGVVDAVSFPMQGPKGDAGLQGLKGERGPKVGLWEGKKRERFFAHPNVVIDFLCE